MLKIILKKGRQKSLLRKHPWVLSGAVERIEGRPSPGDTVDVLSSEGSFLGKGAFSPHSQIRVRMWTFEKSERIDSSFFYSKIRKAASARCELKGLENCSAVRIVHAESDELPGIIIDRYGTFLVCQFLSAGAEKYKDIIVSSLVDIFKPEGIFERSDEETRKKEGLLPRSGPLSGKEPPDKLEIEEKGCRYLVDVRQGHKTGFYIDQRDNRQIVKEHAEEKNILNVFSYTGGFAVAALKGGARRIINIDSSRSLLRLAGENIRLNAFSESRGELIKGDAFSVLRELVSEKKRFDIVILDPPKFITSRANLVKASRGYKDINRLAFHLLKDTGLLFSFSCSGLMSPELFQKIVADAALDAGRFARIIRRMTQPADHPVSLNFPESLYLKGLVCRIG